LARRRRKRRSVEIRNSLRLGVLLAGLAAINVYVFFFNRKTAPREVLNLQSTSRSLDERPRDPLALLPGAAPGRPIAAPAVAPARTPTVRPPRGRPEAVAQALPPSPPKPVDAPWEQPVAVPEETEEADEAGAPRGSEVERKFGNADTLGQVLAREGFGPAGPKVIALLAKLVDPKTIRGGQTYVVRLDDEGAPESFEYRASAILRFIVDRSGDRSVDRSDGAWEARKVEQPVESRTIEVGGLVESSLYESVQKTGESTALVALLVDLFAWDVNFYTDQQPGDHWKVIVEKQLLAGKHYRYGRVLAAEYGGRVGTFRAFYFAPRSGGPGRYYDEKGQAISKTMLKTPLRYVRISSKFDRKRFHPILHVEKAHLGIDYAAPTGTPVWASASGRVVEVGPKRGSGNTIVLAHSGGLSTRYYHLSRFARGLHPGQQVKQKDLIGYVGMTGLATGPHLHFSVTKNGAFVDPSKLQVSRDTPVADRAAFLEAIRPRLAAMKSIQPGALAQH
jgi:murein DD-endopeptidase MepM/ murein hydrolase activator NlpD